MGLPLDVVGVVRRVSRSPASSLAVVLLLGISLGGALFLAAVSRALLDFSLPYADPERIVVLSPSAPDWGLVQDLRSRDDLFEEFATYSERAANIAADDWSERVLTVRASAEFLPLVRVRPAAGRSLAPRDFAPGAPPAFLISDRLWRRRFGASPDAIGATLSLDGRSGTIVGVLPASFRTLAQLERSHAIAADRDPQVLVPLAGDPQRPDLWSTDNVSREIPTIARLRTSADLARANGSLAPVLEPAQRRYRYPVPFAFVPLQRAVAGSLPSQLTLLSLATAILLVAGCANAENLLLTRFEARREEYSVCMALGASPARIAAMVLSESLTLSVAGAALGLLLASLAIGAARAATFQLVQMEAASIDGVVIILAVLLALFAGTALSMWPAARAGRVQPGTHRLNGGVASSAGSRVASVLLASQVAVAVALVIVGGLLARAFMRSVQGDAGYSVDGVLSAEISLDRHRYGPAAVGAFFGEILERAARIPDVARAAVVGITPGGEFDSATMVIVNGRGVFVDAVSVSSRYFDVLSMRFLVGGGFTAGDHVSRTGEVVVNEAFARQQWGTPAAAHGRVFWSATKAGNSIARGSPFTVVGVVADARDAAFGNSARPKIYLYYAGAGPAPDRHMTVLLRSRSGNAGTLGPSLRDVMRSIDPWQPLYNVQPLSALHASRFVAERMLATLVGILSVLTLVVAAFGVFAVMSHAAAARRQELAIRMALGASPASIVTAIGARGARLIAIGVECGVLIAVISVALLRASLFSSWHIDVATTLGGVLLVIAAAGAALLIPAVHAAKADPLETLRHSF